MARVEWTTLVFFATLFVVIEALNRLGLLEFIGQALFLTPSIRHLNLCCYIAFLANLFLLHNLVVLILLFDIHCAKNKACQLNRQPGQFSHIRGEARGSAASGNLCHCMGVWNHLRLCGQHPFRHHDGAHHQ